MTGMGTLPGGGFSIIPGSTPFGGQITPLDSESRSLSGARSVVSPERGGGATSGGQSRSVDGGGGPWAHTGGGGNWGGVAGANPGVFELFMGVIRRPGLLFFFQRGGQKKPGGLRCPASGK